MVTSSALLRGGRGEHAGHVVTVLDAVDLAGQSRVLVAVGPGLVVRGHRQTGLGHDQVARGAGRAVVGLASEAGGNRVGGGAGVAAVQADAGQRGDALCVGVSGTDHLVADLELHGLAVQRRRAGLEGGGQRRGLAVGAAAGHRRDGGALRADDQVALGVGGAVVGVASEAGGNRVGGGAGVAAVQADAGQRGDALCVGVSGTDHLVADLELHGLAVQRRRAGLEGGGQRRGLAVGAAAGHRRHLRADDRGRCGPGELTERRRALVVGGRDAHGPGADCGWRVGPGPRAVCTDRDGAGVAVALGDGERGDAIGVGELAAGALLLALDLAAVGRSLGNCWCLISRRRPGELVAGGAARAVRGDDAHGLSCAGRRGRRVGPRPRPVGTRGDGARVTVSLRDRDRVAVGVCKRPAS